MYCVFYLWGDYWEILEKYNVTKEEAERIAAKDPEHYRIERLP